MGPREEDEIVICRVSTMIYEMLNVEPIPPPLLVDWPEIVPTKMIG